MAKSPLRLTHPHGWAADAACHSQPGNPYLAFCELPHSRAAGLQKKETETGQADPSPRERWGGGGDPGLFISPTVSYVLEFSPAYIQEEGNQMALLNERYIKEFTEVLHSCI